MTKAQKAVAAYAAGVSVSRRIGADMYIGKQSFDRLTDVVYTAFMAGWEQAEDARKEQDFDEQDDRDEDGP